MKALAVSQIPEGSWQLELKFDGYRALAACRNGAISLYSRNNNELTADYPEVAEGLRRLKVETALLDGEIVALDEHGRPSFQMLQGLGQSAKRPPIIYYIFDVLVLDGEPLVSEPLEIRRVALEKLLKKAPKQLKLSPTFSISAAALLDQVRSQGLEGIIAKAAGSRYEPGRRSGTWLKCRVAHEQEFVVGGYTPPQGARTHFGALLVGYYRGAELLYAGKVGTGFNQRLLKELHAVFQKHERADCPFANLPLPSKPRFGQGMTKSAMREVHWLNPELVAQIRFSEWTREGMLRQPVFLGMREDKAAKDVVRESVVAAE